MAKICISCGKHIDENSKYCPHCGKITSITYNNSQRKLVRSKKTIIKGSIIAIILFIIGIAIGANNFQYIPSASIFGGPLWQLDRPALAAWVEANGNKGLLGLVLIVSAIITEIVTLVLFCSAKNAENLKEVLDAVKEK